MNGNSLPAELQRVHMVGIGGAGMSGIARILLDRGGLVSGSDAKESRGVAALRARGALIRIGHDESSLDLLPGGPTAVVSTHAAIPRPVTRDKSPDAANPVATQRPAEASSRAISRLISRSMPSVAPLSISRSR